MAWRSSGTRATPCASTAWACRASGWPSSHMLPALAWATPHKSPASRPWPLPETPAMPSISPASISRETPCRCTRSPRALSCRTASRGALPEGLGRGGRVSRCRPTTDWPTIQRASSALLVSAVRASATVLPPRSTCTRCEIAITSSSLWLMKITAMPCASSWRWVSNRLTLSCGVSTAVGSSSTSTRAPRYRAFRISTRWRAPTDRSATVALASTRRPAPWATWRKRASARVRRVIGEANDSVPSITLSSTDKLSASVKCWCTMPIPAASAARVSPGGSGRPNTSTCPASAR